MSCCYRCCWPPRLAEAGRAPPLQARASSTSAACAAVGGAQESRSGSCSAFWAPAARWPRCACGGRPHCQCQSASGPASEQLKQLRASNAPGPTIERPRRAAVCGWQLAGVVVATVGSPSIKLGTASETLGFSDLGLGAYHVHSATPLISDRSDGNLSPRVQCWTKAARGTSHRLMVASPSVNSRASITCGGKSLWLVVRVVGGGCTLGGPRAASSASHGFVGGGRHPGKSWCVVEQPWNFSRAGCCSARARNRPARGLP
jgi:hypothetical protein|eukprot:COSAG01_NODE_584_length_15174_cov_27.387901_15_plen_260_part_00